MHFDYNISFIVLMLIGRKAKPFKYLKGQKQQRLKYVIQITAQNRQDKFEDTKEIIRSRKSKKGRHNGHRKDKQRSAKN